MFTAGNCPMWFTLSGATVGTSFVTAAIGTSLPEVERMYSFAKAAGSR